MFHKYLVLLLCLLFQRPLGMHIYQALLSKCVETFEWSLKVFILGVESTLVIHREAKTVING
jgi:hypothetical protein